MKTTTQSLAVLTILNDLDIQVPLTTNQFDGVSSGKWTTIHREPISTSRIGPMAMMITKLTVEIRVMVTKSRLYLEYHFRYDHPSGSNGYRAEKTILLDCNGEWNRHAY